MLSGEGNAGERLKTTIGLIRKTQLSTCNTLFWYISLPLFCTVKLLETSEFYVLWRKCRTCSRSLVFHLIFTLHWSPLPFLILSPPLQNVHVVLPTKKCLLCFLAPALDL